MSDQQEIIFHKGVPQILYSILYYTNIGYTYTKQKNPCWSEVQIQLRVACFYLPNLASLLEKEMATHSSVLVWRIPGTGEPGGLLSVGSHRVGHDWSDLAAASLGGFPCGLAGKESICNVWDLDLIPGLERYPREGRGYPLQYYGLENSMDCIVHEVTKSWTRLSNFHLLAC